MASQRKRYTAPDRRQQILRVALELFARQGFEGTTTRQIAERARVSEALLFRHFPHKEDLYWAVIDHKCRTATLRRQVEETLRANQADREAFVSIADDFLRRNSEDTSLSRLLWFSALENHRLSHRFFRTYIARTYEALAEHIRGRIRSGAFRSVDPLLAARGFLGMVVYHFLIQELFGGKRYQKFDRRKVCEALVDIWLEGVAVPGEARPEAPATVESREGLALSARPH